MVRKMILALRAAFLVLARHPAHSTTALLLNEHQIRFKHESRFHQRTAIFNQSNYLGISEH